MDTEIIFSVEEVPAGGYQAKALGLSGSFNADVFKSPVPVTTYLTNTLNVSGTFSVKRWF